VYIPTGLLGMPSRQMLMSHIVYLMDSSRPFEAGESFIKKSVCA
jgi:hypothetical protein